MNQLQEYIKKAESVYQNKLEDFFVSHYPETYLISHGLGHHRRVWNYAKELLRDEPDSGYITCQLVENLIVACYLHDIGMVKDKGFRHGHISREYCIEFLESASCDKEYFHDAIESIEHHDKKMKLNTDGTSGLLRLLTTADDLDAFGYAGIFRYLEIYLSRGIDLPEASTLIVENAQARFKNFETSFGIDSDLVKKHRIRFQVLKSYFEGLSSEIGR